MKISKVILVSVLVTSLAVPSAFALGMKGQQNQTTSERSSATASSSVSQQGAKGERSKGDSKGPGGFDQKNRKGGPMGDHKNPVDELVTEGTITQDQATAVETAIKSAREANQTPKEALDALVTAGTITQAQEDAILSKMPQRGPMGDHKNPIDELVTAGTITQDQATAVKAAMKATREAKQTPKEALDTLVAAGTITQAQEDAILSKMPQRGPVGNHQNPVDELVTDGTITQDQATAVKVAMKAARESKQTPKEALDALVTAGTITQAQEDAILNSFPTHKK